MSKDSSIKVVLVEDDPMVQEVNRQFIERVSGFKVVAMERNGKEGMQLIKEIQPQLVLLDIYMPYQSGTETIQQIREADMDVDVIIITAADDIDTIKKTLHFGALDYIIKPFQFERLRKALENYREYYESVTSESKMSQKQLDQLLYSSTTTVDKRNLPKGLNELTLKQVMMYLLKQTKSRSAEEVAEGIGIARVTARRYLEYLEKNGEIQLDMQYGGVGRPVNRYRKHQANRTK